MKLRSLFLGVAFCIAATGCASKPDTSLLYPAMAYGEVQLLNDIPSDSEKQLYIKLYKTPKQNTTCFNETESACQFQYTLAVSSFDEYPEVNVYQLEQGFIQDLKWGKTGEVDTAVLYFTGSDLEKSNSPKLNYRALITLDSIQVTPQ